MEPAWPQWGAAAAKRVWEGVVENPRRTIHALKVGLALSITSATVLEKRLYGLLGDNAIWSVMSVVVVFELTAGATIYKGSNRALGTLLAGILALGVEFLADCAGPIGEPYIVALSILVVGTIATYTRFCEPFKSNYDYGVMIFLLTFSLIIVSSYRVAGYVHLAMSRFLNILLGGVICLVTNILIKPIWASEDLHNIVRANFHNLSKALEGFATIYIKKGVQQLEESLEDDPIYDSYNVVLSSKNNEESLANYATWEPRCKGNKGVWKQYIKVGGMLRKCTYTVASLHGFLKSNMQASYSLRMPFSILCENVAMGAAALLKKMGENIAKKERNVTKEALMKGLYIEVENLKKEVSGFGELSFLQGSLKSRSTSDDKLNGENGRRGLNTSFDRKETIHELLATVSIAHFLIELVPRLSDLVDSVTLLEELARFRVPKDGIESSPILMGHKTCFDTITIQTTD